MDQFKKYKVVPNLPEKLKPLEDIAYNFWLAWNPQAIKLFIAMDSDLWEKVQHNPVRMLAEIAQQKLEELAGDDGFLMELERVSAALNQYLQTAQSINDNGRVKIAYFSAEYGLNDTLPIYSGGLGILSGDHVKSASGLNLNFRGVGLLYQLGYFQQYLNQDGWQQDFYQMNDFHHMQVREVLDPDGRPMEIDMDLPGRKIYLKVWKIDVGRVSIFMLDSNLEKNGEYDRKLTAQLYGGDREIRLQQEIILGVGGVKMLDRLGIDFNVLHMNEGHSAFAPFERCRLMMKVNALGFQEAMEITRKTCVFTTHSNVQAAHDAFAPDMIRRYFSGYVRELGISVDEFLSFGRLRPDNRDEDFSMTVAAIRNSSFINGVSKLHASVSRDLWKSIWGDVPLEHLPIQPITNGVHVPSWLSFEMHELFERYLGANWWEKLSYKEVPDRMQNIPDPELWNIREIRRRRLIAFTRRRLKKQLTAKGASNSMINESQESLNPEALTIGFARRFASYKRGYLILRDPERLLSILNNPQRPVQIIFAGKAHPQDQAGKELIRDLIHFIATHRLQKKIAFIEDYDFNVARYIVQGVDVWLNNPLRPQEACGTSGMKAACNGVLNFSILDGWWDEAYDYRNGWAIGNREVYQDQAYQDEVESKALYTILENDIVPLFYERKSDDLPREWIRMIKHSMATIASQFNSQRMLKEYFGKFYKPAAENFFRLSGSNWDAVREFCKWKNKMKREFPAIRVDRVLFDAHRPLRIGETLDVQVEAFLGKNPPEDVRVDVYDVRFTGEGVLIESRIENLSQVEKLEDSRFRFSGKFICQQTGSFGFKVRITPFHPLMMDPYELNLVVWG